MCERVCFNSSSNQSAIWKCIPVSKYIKIPPRFVAVYLTHRNYACACMIKFYRFIIIIGITMSYEDNIFGKNASLPYGPSVNTDTDYYRTCFTMILISLFLHYLLDMRCK